jgi:hypothetical protein
MLTRSMRLVLIASTLTSSQAFALIHGQALVGKRWAEITPDGGDKTGAQATELAAAVHVDPIPLVPVSAGLSLAVQNWRPEDLGAKTAAGSELGLEVQAWVPLVPFATPYAKLRWVMLGKMAVEGDSTDETTGLTTKYAQEYDTSGVHVNVGAKFDLLPLVSMMVELGNSFGESTLEKSKQAGVDQTLSDEAKKPSKFNSRAMLVGLEVGF